MTPCLAEVCGPCSSGIMGLLQHFFFPLSMGIPEILGEGLTGDLQFVLSFYIMFGCGSLHLLLPATSSSLFDNDLASHRFISI